MKKILALLLCVLTVFSAFAVVSFAEEPLRYVVIGDSIARGAGIYNSSDACYGRIVADTNGYDYLNFGIDGYTSWQLRDYIRTAEVTDALANADVVSLSIGGNDYLQQNLPKVITLMAFGDYKIVNDIQENYREHLTDILGYIVSINPDVVILAQTLYNPRTDLIRFPFGEATKRVNEVVGEMPAAFPGNVYLVDTVPYLEGAIDCVAMDGIHPSAYGNIVLAQLVLDKLYELGLGENLDPVVNGSGIDQIPFSSNILHAFVDFFRKVISFFTSL